MSDDVTNKPQLPLGFRIVLVLSYVAALLLTLEALIFISTDTVFLSEIHNLLTLDGGGTEVILLNFAIPLLNAPAFILGLIFLYCSKAIEKRVAPQSNSYATWDFYVGLYVVILSFILFFCTIGLSTLGLL